MIDGLLFSVLGFVLGSIPFSPWIGNLALHKDIRQFGDHNPGATNVWRAGNFYWFSLALFLDISKGALPVGLAYHIFDIQDGWIIPIGLAPPLGHAFSPFLKGKGGKAIAAAFGVWIGLTIWTLPLIMLSLLTISALLIYPYGWSILFTTIPALAILAMWFWDPFQFGLLLLHTGLLSWTHRADLSQRPALRWKGTT
jgi:glycerol-3-phosphate acyltransferase PlsY